jgi:hypothetical protein
MIVKQAEADLRNAKPLYVEMPVNPKLTATEWRNIVAQHAVIPGKDFGIKDGKEPQPGNECYYIVTCLE